MSSAGVKRTASSESQYFDHDEPHTSIQNSIQKKSRSHLAPKLIGPLTFEGDGSDLHQAIFPAQPSNLPGVYRLAPPPHSSPIRLWTPNTPFTSYLETELSKLIESIDEKCIFIFDPRTIESESTFGNSIPLHLIQSPLVQRFGVIVSRYAPPTPEVTVIPYIQDPNMNLGRLCNYYDYLGPCCVCVKNSEVVSSHVLRPNEEFIDEILNEWAYI